MRLLCSWNSPGKNTGVGHSLLQGIFPTQGWNLGLLYCRQILYQLSHHVFNEDVADLAQKVNFILEIFPYSNSHNWSF